MSISSQYRLCFTNSPHSDYISTFIPVPVSYSDLYSTQKKKDANETIWNGRPNNLEDIREIM